MKQLLRLAAFSFSISFLLRLLPEILLKGYPAGYDVTARYIPLTENFTKTWEEENMASAISSLPGLLRLSPLFFIFASTLHRTLRITVFEMYKLLSPTLYALTCLSFSVYTYKARKLNYDISLKATLIFSFHLASLRMSWDLLRTNLCLSLGFLILTAIITAGNNLTRSILTLCSPMLPLVNQPASVFLSVLFIEDAFKNRKVKWHLISTAGLILLTLTPSLWFMGSNLILKNLPSKQYKDFSSYKMAILLLYIIFYGWMIPCISKGLRGFNLTAFFFTLLALSPLLVGEYAPILAVRWLFLLVIPYTIVFIEKCGQMKGKINQLILILVILSGLNYAGGYISPTSIARTNIGYDKAVSVSGKLLEGIGMLIPPHLATTSLGEYPCNPLDIIRASSWVSNHYENITVIVEEGKFYLIHKYVRDLRVISIPDFRSSLQKSLQSLNETLLIYITTKCRPLNTSFSKVYNFKEAQVYIIESGD